MLGQIKHAFRTSALRTLLGPRRSMASGLNRNLAMVLLSLVFCAEAAIGLLMFRDLSQSHSEMQRMYERSVRGLRQIGEMQYEAQETRRSTLYALTTNDPNLQVGYADVSHAADHWVTEGISEYLTQAGTPRELAAGRTLAADWGEYLKVRDYVLGLILESGTEQAVEVDLASGVPKFEKVNQDLEAVKQLYDMQATQQLATVAKLSRSAMGRLISVLGLCLLLGSLAVLAIQRAQLRSETHIAKLQMDFVAAVSHELRTPVATIFAAAENIRDGLPQEREKFMEQGGIISHYATQLNDLVEQVLLFTTTAEGKPWHAVHPLAVSEIVESALDNSSRLLKEAGIRPETKIEPGLPMVEGDLGSLSRCLQNLIANAAKYGGRDKWIGLFAEIDDTSVIGRHVRICVQDHGIGIRSSELPFVFDPFFRSAQVVAAQIRGTGLGLAIAKKSAEAFGGTLSVESQIGIGSTFTLRLPALPEAREPNLAPGTASENLEVRQ
jgi:signal transduction histidine kinase